MNTIKLLAAAALATALTVPMANASTVILETRGNTSYTTDSFTGFTTNAQRMAGMVVSGRTTERRYSAEFDVTGTGRSSVGNAVTRAFTLTQSGNTYAEGTWGIIVNAGERLTQLRIDGAPGQTIFDTDLSGPSTEGSSVGLPFAPTGAFADLQGIVVATYTGMVAITGTEGVGDAYTRLTLDLSGLEGGGLGEGTWNFSHDTDNASRRSPLQYQTPAPVPLPAGGLLLVAALGGLGLMRRKRAA